MSIKPIFAWYDLWIGAFWDQAKRRLYIFPIPMFGVVIQFADPSAPPNDAVRATPPHPCRHEWRRSPYFGRWRCMSCGAEGDLPFEQPQDEPQ